MAELPEVALPSDPEAPLEDPLQQSQGPEASPFSEDPLRDIEVPEADALDQAAVVDFDDDEWR